MLSNARMVVQHSLNQPLLRPLDDVTKHALQYKLWGAKQTFNAPEIVSYVYWKFYERQCAHALHDGGRHISVRTHKDVLDIIEDLRADYERKEIRNGHRNTVSLTPTCEQDVLLDASIDLAATILLMIDFGSIQFGFSGRKQISWHDGSIRSQLEDFFCVHPSLGYERVKLEKTFKALNLVRMAGLEVIWTDNLLDHLRLTDDDTKVHIFHHASFLQNQCTSGNSLLPEELITETISTLALLFPSSDLATSKWIKRCRSTTDVDERLVRCGSLKTDDRQIERFRFWRDRLIILKQVFDEAHPRTLSQWWYDRRNGALWFGFWNAVAILVLTAMTLLFGVIQCVESGIQAYASMVALRQVPP